MTGRKILNGACLALVLLALITDRGVEGAVAVAIGRAFLAPFV